MNKSQQGLSLPGSHMFNLLLFVVKVFDGWVMKGEKFPSSQDHPLPLNERYVDYCESGSLRRSVRSSQNVAMVFFRVHNPGSGFTLMVRKHINPFREYDSHFTLAETSQHSDLSYSD